MLLLAAGLASTYVVDALGGGSVARGLISGCCYGLAGVLAARTAERRRER